MGHKKSLHLTHSEKDKYVLNKKKGKNYKKEITRLNKLLAASAMDMVIKIEFLKSLRKKLVEIESSNAKTLNKAIQEVVKEIDVELRQPAWIQFKEYFREIHGDFLARLLAVYPDLTPQDQKLCAYLRLELNTNEIAQLMSVSVRGVEIARYRLRKRLKLETKQNLSTFILEF